MPDFIVQVVGEAIRLLVQAGQPWLAVLLAVAAGLLGVVLWKGGPILWRALRSVRAPPEWDPEKGTGPLSPPLDMPEGGAPLHQDRPKDWS